MALVLQSADIVAFIHTLLYTAAVYVCLFVTSNQRWKMPRCKLFKVQLHQSVVTSATLNSCTKRNQLYLTKVWLQ